MNTIAKGEVPGLTKAQNPIQIVVLIAVSIITVWTLYMVPSWQAPGDPFLSGGTSYNGTPGKSETCSEPRFLFLYLVDRDSRSEGISPFHSEACLTDLRGIRWCNAGELRSDVVDDVEVAIRSVVVSQADIGTDCLRI
jgi:hypothetical protein